VDATVDFIKSNKDIERSLGLIHPTSVTSNISSPLTGTRSMQVYFAPTNSASYNGLLDLKSGVLTSYSLQGGVTEPVRGSFGLQFLDMSGSINTTARDNTNYEAGLIKPENQALTGLGDTTTISMAGFGLTGITIQSFSFSLGLSRASVQELGKRFPTSRPLTDVNASLQCQGFFEGINNSITGLDYLYCGAPAAGTISLALSPACSSASPTTIAITNPYLDNFSIDAQVGNFSTFAVSFSAPLGPNPLEITDGSRLTIT